MKIELNTNAKNAIIAIAVSAGFIAYFWCMSNLTPVM